jgi:hypothetical protein
VTALMEGRFAPKGAKATELARSLASRGMMILEADGRAYLPVHPRMALSNLFRAYDERLNRQRRERRLLVDKLTLELLPLVGAETKRTKAGPQRGGTTATE